MRNDLDHAAFPPAAGPDSSTVPIDPVPASGSAPAVPPNPGPVIPVPRRPIPGKSDEAYLRGVRAQADTDIAAGR